MKRVLLEVEPQVSRQLISETSLRSGRFAVTCYSLFTPMKVKRLEQAPISKHLNSSGVISSHHFCFLSFVTTQTNASVVLCKSCPHRSLSSGSRNTTIVVTWFLVIQKYLCVPESPERTLFEKSFDRGRETRHLPELGVMRPPHRWNHHVFSSKFLCGFRLLHS